MVGEKVNAHKTFSEIEYITRQEFGMFYYKKHGIQLNP